MMIGPAARTLAFIAALAALPAAGVAWGSEFHAAGACSDGESWMLGRGLDARQRSEFEKSGEGDTTPARGYAYAEVLEKSGATEEARLLGVYAKGRALLRANLVHPAFEEFARAAQAFPTAEVSGVQAAAVECLNRIAREYPALQVPPAVFSRLPQFFSLAPRSPQPFQELALRAIEASVAQHATADELTGLVSLLKGSGAYEALAIGMAAELMGDHAHAIPALEAFLKARGPAPALKKRMNSARLLLARAYYTRHDYAKAAENYKRIEKSSNEFSEALSELAWAHLLDENYSEAIGIATNVQVGSLRNIFVPEAPMVMAMSLNELCQYPDSLRAIHKFQNDYRPSYSWLKRWSQAGGARAQPLYPLAIAFVARKRPASETAGVPSRIASEWIRSNTFIALQDEIALSFREERARQALGSQVDRERSSLKADPVAAAALSGLASRVSGLPAASSKLRQDRVARINAELAARSSRMLTQLDEIAENTKLIQVEIYSGASHDIIWQNAHPDFRDVSRKWKAEGKREQAASRVWDWGSIRKSGDKVELWEDEMGAFKASLFDNCSNKQRYMALRSIEE